jgi:hypothetical protein
VVSRSIVRVIWHDAHLASDGWCAPDDVSECACVVETVGWLVPDGKADHVTVAQSVADDGEMYAVFCVPVGMVVSMSAVQVS